MSEFIKSSKVGKMPRGRNLDEQLTTQDHTEMKSVIGSLQWMCGVCRPDLAAGTSLCQKSKPVLRDLKDAYELLQQAHDTHDNGIVFRSVPLSEVIVVGYGDSSWANADELKSQTGLVVTVTSKHAVDGSADGVIVDWRSTRTKRVVRSTLAAEAIAADNCSDHSFFTAACISEIVQGVQAIKALGTSMQIPVYVCTDCRSLYDAFQKVSPSIEEKRTLLDILSIRQTLAENGLRWVPTTEQLADGLTKHKKQLASTLQSSMRHCVIRLKDVPAKE